MNGAVASTEIVDILSAAGLSSPDISILSDEFLAEVGQIEKKNLALEALRKLLRVQVCWKLGDKIKELHKLFGIGCRSCQIGGDVVRSTMLGDQR